jgi:phage replication initiation protein
MHETEFRNTLRNERTSYGISQGELADSIGVTRQYINEIETGKSIPSKKLKRKIAEHLKRCSFDTPLFLLIDYLRVRFPTTDAQEIIRNILHLKTEYLIHENYGFYSYEEHYAFGDIMIMVSQDISKGVLLELKGKGCRQLESFLQVQNRSWYDFLQCCINNGGVLKRLDLAINDVAGLLDIPALIGKCKRGELITKSRKFEYIELSALSSKTKRNNDLGSTLYIGSRSSNQYFCLYQKDKEQSRKHLKTEIKNRFEIRLKNEKAQQAVENLLTTENPECVVFSIINRQMHFIDIDNNSAINPLWAWFTGNGRPPIELEMRAEKYTMERTLNWIKRQVAPSIKLIEIIDEITDSTLLSDMMKQVTLKDRQQITIKQMTTDIENITDTAILTTKG